LDFRIVEWMRGEKKLKMLKAAVFLTLVLSNAGLGAPDELYGVVTKVVDGSTFDMAMEKTDLRIAYSTERMVLADVECPDLGTLEGIQARDLASAVLLNRRVFIDVSDLGNGRDAQRRLICVAYLSGYYGQPLLSPCYNRILVDSGLGMVKNSTDNEFNPADWWYRPSMSRPGYNDSAEAAINRLETITRDLLRPIQGELGKEYDKRAKEASDWLAKQIHLS
jgi:hypothetical protein